MPLPKKGGAGGQAPSAPVAPTRGGLPKRQVRAAAPEAEYPTPTPSEDDGVSGAAVTAGVLGGAGVVGLAAKMATMPGVLGALGKAVRATQTVRQQAMLSGLAIPKSVLGNMGAVAETAMERGTTTPIKQFFSKQTLRDAKDSWVKGGVGDGTPGVDQGIGQGKSAISRLAAYLAPGRVMGAMDDATQGALRRSGLSNADAQAAVLQRPLNPQISEALASAPAQYFQPFRRTPINQVLEGGKKLTRFQRGEMSRGEKVALGVQSGVGALHGAATADEDVPLTLPMGVALAARGGLPYGLAAMMGRSLAGGDLPGSGIAGSLLPASEWGLESSMTDPFKPFKKPAALTALEKLTGQ
jgi:hypothetical protein